MEKEQAMQIIISQCEDIDGCLFKLRANNQFDAAQFQNLVNAIEAYRDSISGDAYISRRIVVGLFYLVGIVESMMHYFEQQNLPDKENLSRTHADIWNAVESLYVDRVEQKPL